MKATHPIWSGIGGFLLVPAASGLVAKLLVSENAPAKEQAVLYGAVHAASAFALWKYHDKFDGNMHSFATGAIWGEAIDAVFVPTSILVADSFGKALSKGWYDTAPPGSAPPAQPTPPSLPAQVSGAFTDALAPSRGKVPASTLEQGLAMLKALRAT